MGFLLLLNTFLVDSGILLIEGIYANILIITLTASFGNIWMALSGAVNYDDKRMTLFPSLMGLCGLFIFALTIIHLLGGETLIADGQLSKNGAFLMISISFIAIPIVYFYKYRQYLKQIKE